MLDGLARAEALMGEQPSSGQASSCWQPTLGPIRFAVDRRSPKQVVQLDFGPADVLKGYGKVVLERLGGHPREHLKW